VDEHQHDHQHDQPAAGDCVESLESLYVFLDGELTAERRTVIRGHLDGCPDCYGAFDFEAELRSVVSASCREEVPESLRVRVSDALRRLQDG
jgi:mycothiol system anti-sigma-R factor